MKEKRYTQRELKTLANLKAAIDITNATSRKAIPEEYDEIGYSVGVSGVNGLLLKGQKTKKLYVITKRSYAISVFLKF